MMEINKKAVEYVINKIKGLGSNIMVQFDQNAAENRLIYNFYITSNEQTIKIQYNQNLMDDFEVAIQKHSHTDDYYKLENFIKYKIYIELGLKGLIHDFEISSEIINDKSRMKDNDSEYNLSFDDWMYEVLNRGFRKLSDFLEHILKEHNLELTDIREEKKYIDKMISYSQKNCHLKSDGVGMKIRGFLKAAAVCEIIEKENERAQSNIYRIRRDITKDIYKIVALLRTGAYRSVKMPECIKEYYEARKILRSDNVNNYIINNHDTKSTYKKDTSIKAIPKAFISYSWDDNEHKEWVNNIAKQLRSDGVETILDQWHAIPGEKMPEFMEKAIRENDFVLIVCTPRYKRKSDSREGGVGYEGDIMTAEVYTTKNNRKFIPILRGKKWTTSSPSWLLGSYRIDLSGNPYDQKEYDKLCNTLHGKMEEPPPVIRKKPFNKTNKSSQFQKEKTEKISFHIPNPLLWKISNEKYTAIGNEDTFAWSENIIEGDVVISVDIESNHKDGEGVIIVCGGGVKWSKGCLIFNITPDVQSIRAHTPYDGVEFLSDTKKQMKFINNKFAVTIELIGDKATMYVDGKKIVSTFLPNNIERKGRIGLFKYHERPEVTYSNIVIKK